MFKKFCFLLITLFTSTAALAVPTTPKSDFVFLIDATGSMAGEIAGVKAGFASFVSGLSSANVDSRFAIVLFGGEPELILDFTADTTAVQNKLNQIQIGSNPGVHNNHNVNPEAGLEAIRMALGAAPVSAFANNNIPEDGVLDYRSDARKNLILATDEDGDRPFHVANRFPGQNTTDPTNPLNASWQAAVDATAQAVINNEAYLNMLINIGDAPSKSQYGDYTKDVSDPDLLNYDPDATLAGLLADPLTANSLQAQVLGSSKDLIARTFNVAGANDPNFINNFYAAKVQEASTDPGPGVPEPSVLALLGIGFIGLALARRRKLRA